MGTLRLPHLFNKGGRHRKNVDPKIITHLRAKGTSWRRIAKKVGVSVRTARRIVQGRFATVGHTNE